MQQNHTINLFIIKYRLSSTDKELSISALKTYRNVIQNGEAKLETYEISYQQYSVKDKIKYKIGQKSKVYNFFDPN